ncbi:MAG: S41 family peptidase [Planctomycetota bacterium]
MMNRVLKNAALIGVLFVVLVGVKAGFARSGGGDSLGELERFIEVRHLLSELYVTDVDAEAAASAAIEGMIDSLNDPYTNYLSPDDLKQFNESVDGSFVGIGAEVDIFKDRLRIVAPLEDSPAWNSGVQPGDIVLEIEGEDTLGMTLQDAIKRLKGVKGTDVTITVRHRSGEEAEITITRDLIKVRSVRGVRRVEEQRFDYMLDPVNKVGYIRLTQFGNRTDTELAEAIEELKGLGVKGLILDVRFNGGGLLSQAQSIGDMFLPAGKTIVSTKGRKVAESVLKSENPPLVPTSMPIVLLANENSASASEILTGALKDNQRALIVGTRTFGKGSVQQLRPLGRDRGAIKLTTAYYYIPSGEKIHKVDGAERWGVDPSPGAYVPMTPEAIREMLTLRRDEPTSRPYDNASVTPDFLRETIQDPQLAAALEAVTGKLDSGDWPEVGRRDVDLLVKAKQKQDLERRLELLDETRQEVEKQLAELIAQGGTAATAPATQPVDSE